MNKKFFSVIIPVYNGAKYIEATLDTVLNQTCSDYEIIIVNDGSPDNSEDVIKQYMAARPQMPIKYVWQQNKGLGGARNTAIKNSTGQVLALLDQDDHWYPNKLEVVFNIFQLRENIDVVSHCELLRGRFENSYVLKNGTTDQDIFRSILLKNNCFSPSAMAIKRTAIDTVGLFTEDRQTMHFTEDLDLWLRLAKAGCSFLCLPDVLSESIWTKENYSSNKILMQNHTINVLRKHYLAYQKKNWFDMVLFKRRLARLYLSIGLAYLKGKIKERRK